MSKFIKKLQGTSGRKGQALGFGATAQSRDRVPMLIVAMLGRITPDAARDAVSNGAEALLLNAEDMNAQIETLSQITAEIKGTPWGMRLEPKDVAQIGELAKAGCDYLVFTPEMAGQAISNTEMGRVLAIDTSLSDGLARAAGQLFCDAVLFREPHESPLTVHQLLDYQRLADLTGKPAMAFAPFDVSDLGALHEVGITGIVVDFERDNLEERLREAKVTIQRL